MAFMLILIACVVIICKLLRIKVSATCLNVNLYRVDSIDSYGGNRTPLSRPDSISQLKIIDSSLVLILNVGVRLLIVLSCDLL